jgi:uncharacterized protein (TIGR03067 family)
MRFFCFVGLMALGFVGCNRPSGNQQTIALEGKWAVVAIESADQVASPELLKEMAWSINGNEIIGTGPYGASGKMSFKLDQETTPKAIDITALDGNRKGETDLGIYSLQDGRLRVCIGEPHGSRPKELRVSQQSWIIELEKITR